MRPGKNALLLPPSWRPSGFRALDEPGTFSQTLRNLEIATIRLARSIGASLAGAPSRAPRLGRVDSVTTSPSGFRWLVGWVYDSDDGRTDPRVVLSSRDGIVSGGTTILPRPDVAAAFGDSRALHCGFAFPVPATFRDEGSDLQADLRVSGLAG